jgi:type VI secretion system secreted protein Hcp
VGIGRPFKAALLVVVGAAGGAAAVAVATVPDSSGVIHACVATVPAGGLPATGANLRVIDFPTQQCNPPGALSTETALSWNTAGPPGQTGAQGPPGANGRAVTIAGGNTFTISGGQVITVGASPGLTISPPGLGSRAIATASFGGGPTIEIFGFSFGASQGGSNTGTGTGKGKTSSIHEIQISKHLDAASAKLALACANGTHYKNVTIHFTKAGKQTEYDLTDVLIAAYQVGSKGNQPTESLTLSFTKIAIKFKK